MKLLLTGDVHLGRSSSGLERASELIDGSAAAAWLRIVDQAIQQNVAAVIVSGDLIDAGNRYFEASAPLERGIGRLSDSGIELVAVAGNHDHRTTPELLGRLASRGHRVRLLGGGGRWEAHDVKRAGECCRLIGWSFTSESETEDPTAKLPQDLLADTGVPIIGLVHGDLDSSRSKYAPLDRRRLLEQPVRGWLLGHIHARHLTETAGAPWILYPGSPQALDPGERGPHGAWIVDVGGDRMASPTFIELSSIRYEARDLTVDGAPDVDAMRSAADRGLDRIATTESVPDFTKALVIDVSLTGESDAWASARDVCKEIVERDPLVGPSFEVIVRAAEDRVGPRLSIQEIAGGSGVTSSLAQAIQAIEGAGDDAIPTEFAPLMERIMVKVRDRPLQGMVRFGDDLRRLELSDAEARRLAAKAARRLLGAIVAQLSPDGSRPGGKGSAR